MEYPSVVENTKDNDDVESLLLVQDDMTPAGYAKLQWIEEGSASYDNTRDDIGVDMFGRPVLLNNAYFEDMTHDIRSGPAGTTKATIGFPDLDYVPAFQCKSWPIQSKPWLNKSRFLGFPSAETINQFERYGCFLVPVGQPSSPEKELQWRLSFSVQERKIMIGLNPTQYKCYVLLKMVKNDLIKSSIKAKSLTSYHCKTCLFYMLEVTREEIWTTVNLISCVLQCINTIRMWIKNGFIPNYFIPEENMWKGNANTQEALVEILDGLLEKGPEFVFSIHCDSVGRMISHLINEESNEIIKLDNGSKLQYALTQTIASVDLHVSPEDIKDPEKSLPVSGNINNQDTLSDGTAKELKRQEASDKEKTDSNLETLPSLVGNLEEDDDVSQMPSGKQDSIVRPEETLQENLENTEYDVNYEAKGKSDENAFDVQEEYHTLEQDTVVSSQCADWTLTLDEDDKGSIEATSTNEGRPLDLAIYKIHHWCIDSVIGNGKEFLELLRESENIEESIKKNQGLIQWLEKQITKSLVYTGEEMKRAIRFVLPFLNTSLGSLLVARSIKIEDEEARMKDLGISNTRLTEGHQSDAQSGIIKHAAILFMLGRYEACADLLAEVDENNEAHVTSWGRCLKPTDFVNETLCNKIRNECLSTEEVLHKSASVCVTYLPLEIDIIPDDLKYELFKSLFCGTPQISENEDAFDLVTVDSSIYLYYLQYRIYEKLGRKTEQKHALAKMVLVLEEDLNLGHPDTANNLFGRILIEQYEMRAAWQCFCDSWKIRPHQNAAKWHMAVILSELVAVQNAIELGIFFGDDDDSQADGSFSDEDAGDVLYRRTYSENVIYRNPHPDIEHSTKAKV